MDGLFGYFIAAVSETNASEPGKNSYRASERAG